MMKKVILLLSVFYTLVFLPSISAREKVNYQIVPLPREITLTKDAPFILNANTKIVYFEDNVMMKRNAEFLSEYIKKSIGLDLKVSTTNEKRSRNILLVLDNSIDNKEGYKLNVTKKNVTITGQTENGIFYGIQMLRKSLPILEKSDSINLPAVTIKDAPRFGYRGMMLDVARHFFSVLFVKEYIDLLALHNMNTFHFHLTDDQGWRIEIKRYPKLTEVGSLRSSTVLGRNSDVFDGVAHGGYYTQEQLREIVAYAKERYITVIPEVDMPGHMLAALASYPELGCIGGTYQVGQKWGVYKDILCAGNENTFNFIENILDEIIQIFPSKYIHIGGDEAPRIRWEKCPKCQQRIMKEGIIKDEKYSCEDKLQSYFISRVEKYLSSKNRQIIGWDEIMDGNISPTATIMAWRGMGGGIKAAKMGHDVIMTPLTHLYFDYYQTKETEHEPMLVGRYVSVEQVYSLDVPEELDAEARKHILGAQANLWTEYISYPSLAEYQILPRMAALSEVQWTPSEQKNFVDFKQRVLHMMDLYKTYGWQYARHILPEDHPADRWHN